MPTQYIDLEPTWVEQCYAVQRGALPARTLIPACQAADIIRQAQKAGKKSVRFIFLEEGGVEVVVEDKIARPDLAPLTTRSQE